ncbi:MAG: 3-carboxy-cis,cis-muconate cycloisomerase [Aliidongia sp.]
MIRDLAAATPEMLAIFDDAALLRAALDFETALAEAQAAEGLIPAAQATLIATACTAPPIDLAALASAASHAGTLAIPLLAQLRALVPDQDAARQIHRGATSQDLADTALILQAKAAATLIEREADRIARALAALAETHLATPLTGRTLLQAALPVSFGLKAAQWLLGIDEAAARFRTERQGALVLQFGGAAGTLAGLDGRAFAVAERLAATLGLACPPVPWHARRNGIAGLGTALAILCGAAAKIARDIALLAQSEIAEAFEPRIEGRGGSSAMAHKRNPTGCQIILSAALRTPGLAATLLAALPQEHERGLGGWQAEAPVLAELFQLTHGALAALAAIAEGLEIDPARMQANLDQAGIGADLGESVALARRALAHYRKAAQ